MGKKKKGHLRWVENQTHIHANIIYNVHYVLLCLAINSKQKLLPLIFISKTEFLCSFSWPSLAVNPKNIFICSTTLPKNLAIIISDYHQKETELSRELLNQQKSWGTFQSASSSSVFALSLTSMPCSSPKFRTSIMAQRSQRPNPCSFNKGPPSSQRAGSCSNLRKRRFLGRLKLWCSTPYW